MNLKVALGLLDAFALLCAAFLGQLGFDGVVPCLCWEILELSKNLFGLSQLGFPAVAVRFQAFEGAHRVVPFLQGQAEGGRLLIDPGQRLGAQRREVRQVLKLPLCPGDRIANGLLRLVKILNKIAQARDLRVKFFESVFKLLRQILDLHGIVFEALRGLLMPAQQFRHARFRSRHLLAGRFHGIQCAIEDIVLFEREVFGFGERKQPLCQGFNLVLDVFGFLQPRDACRMFQSAELQLQLCLLAPQGLEFGPGAAEALFQSGHFLADAERLCPLRFDLAETCPGQRQRPL